MTKKELEARVSELEDENESLEEALISKNMVIAELEGDIEEMETELGYDLYAMPVFPDSIYKEEPAKYIAEFNRIRHLKEIPA